MLSYHPKNKGYGGWHNFAFKATFANGKEYVRNRTKDAFTRCFIGTHIGSRPCCFECKFKNCRVWPIYYRRFWASRTWTPTGTAQWEHRWYCSTTIRGRAFYKSLGDSVASNAEPLEGAIAGNPHLLHNSAPGKIDRKQFYELLDEKGFDYAMRKLGNNKGPLINRIIRKLRSFIK